MSTESDLADAKAAYHKLLLGKAVVSINVDGVQTQYAQADAARLKLYIQTLEAALDLTGASRRRPARVF